MQIFDKDSPMRCVLRFGDKLTRTWSDVQKLLDMKRQDELNEMVDQVVREQVITSETGSIVLSDDRQSDLFKESLKATVELHDQKKSDKFDGDNKTDKKEVKYIDIFALRILSLLMCRGKKVEKAKVLSQIIVNTKETKTI